MNLVVFIVAVVASSSILLLLHEHHIVVEAQCMKLVTSYHECFHVADDAEEDIDDEFYKGQLYDEYYNGRGSFERAMHLFRWYYETLASCQTAAAAAVKTVPCECFRERMEGEPDYVSFFTNLSNYNAVKRLTAAVKNKYRLRKLEEISRDSVNTQPFPSNTPTLNEFCQKYDFSYHMDAFYDELKACKTSGQTIALAMCIPSTIFNADAQEDFFRCMYSYRDCASELKNFLALGDIARFPQLVTGDLYSYINSLTSRAAATTCLFNTVLFVLSFAFIYIYFI